jgi:tetratricopeptide (TPR) repeat protein
VDFFGGCVSESVSNARLVVTRGVEVSVEKTFSLNPGKCWKRGGLKLTGEHLDQYRHATLSPELYWNEALTRDPGDARCNLGMGRRTLKQGRWDAAEAHFQKAIARLTRRHPSPETGEAHYFPGLTLAFKGEFNAAYPLTGRLAFLEVRMERVLQRDDCTVALATLYNLTPNPERALEILTARRFHPWEGGEGSVLRQFTTAHLRLGCRALAAGNAADALADFTGAMETPASLGEACHFLLALAHHGLGEMAAAGSALSKTLAFTCAEQRAVDLQRELVMA